jgi:hypothetical protein
VVLGLIAGGEVIFSFSLAFFQQLKSRHPSWEGIEVFADLSQEKLEIAAADFFFVADVELEGRGFGSDLVEEFDGGAEGTDGGVGVVAQDGTEGVVEVAGRDAVLACLVHSESFLGDMADAFACEGRGPEQRYRL